MLMFGPDSVFGLEFFFDQNGLLGLVAEGVFFFCRAVQGGGVMIGLGHGIQIIQF
jgi:hypothetical protein